MSKLIVTNKVFTAPTLAPRVIKDYMIDWGHGTGQVEASDMPFDGSYIAAKFHIPAPTDVQEAIDTVASLDPHELNDLQDVTITYPSHDQLLQYSSSLDLWVNRNLRDALHIEATDNQVVYYLDGAFQGCDNFLWDSTKDRLVLGGASGLADLTHTSQPVRLDINGNLTINGSLNNFSRLIGRTEVEVDSIDTTTCSAVHWQYKIEKNNNIRTGIVLACWTPNGAVDNSEVNVAGIGRTRGVVLRVRTTGTRIMLTAKARSDDWTVSCNRFIIV